MQEDKLTHGERLRLECLAQAVALYSMRPSPSIDIIIKSAKEFEGFLKSEA